jgi:hypothetical protein
MDVTALELVRGAMVHCGADRIMARVTKRRPASRAGNRVPALGRLFEGAGLQHPLKVGVRADQGNPDSTAVRLRRSVTRAATWGVGIAESIRSASN